MEPRKRHLGIIISETESAVFFGLLSRILRTASSFVLVTNEAMAHRAQPRAAINTRTNKNSFFITFLPLICYLV